MPSFLKIRLICVALLLLKVQLSLAGGSSYESFLSSVVSSAAPVRCPICGTGSTSDKNCFCNHGDKPESKVDEKGKTVFCCPDIMRPCKTCPEQSDGSESCFCDTGLVASHDGKGNIKMCCKKK
jgi:hypothetical protein